MKFVSLSGAIARARRYVSGHSSVSVDEVKDASRLAEIIRKLSVRVSELESRVPPDGVEFEVDCTSGSTVSMNHGLSGPVRWYVTHWLSPSPTGPQLSYNSSSNSNMLVLNCHSSGRAVIRIEPSQAGLS